MQREAKAVPKVNVTALPELTLRVFMIGLTLSVVMAAANVYLGLKAGMTVSASIPAAVVGMLVLRTFYRNGSILEANQIQTAASAGESLAAGIIFTMPAMLLIHAWESFDLVTTALIAFTGGLLGVLFMIPMRRVFVVDNKELPYPEGVACAAVLEAANEGESNRAEAMQVVVGGLLGAVFKTLVQYVSYVKGTLEGAALVGGRVLYFGSDISPALVGVGYIVRLNVAALIFIGGALGWLVCMPILPELYDLVGWIGGLFGLDGLDRELWRHEEADASARELWSEHIRYIGVGAMVVGGIESIVRVRHGLVRAVVELRKRIDKSAALDVRDRDLPSPVIIGLSLVAVLSIAGIYFQFTSDPAITGVTTVVMVVMSFFFVAVASYIVGLVGNSNSPVSGMTITAVLFTGLVLFIFGFSGAKGMVATLGVAAIVCCAACTSGDVCNDLKTGSLVGASPRRQQIMQIGGIAVAAVVMGPVLQLLHNAYRIGSSKLPAPQASLFASLAQGFFGEGELPWGMVGVGVFLGILILIVDRVLESRGSSFRAHLMPVAVGVYLPFGLAVPIFVGGLLAHLHGRGARDSADRDRRLHGGVLFSSGIIAGESLMGVLIAILAAVEFVPSEGAVATVVLAVFVLLAFYRYTRPSR